MSLGGPGNASIFTVVPVCHATAFIHKKSGSYFLSTESDIKVSENLSNYSDKT